MTSQSSPNFRRSATIAFTLLAIGLVPLGAMASGLYHVGMCDPTPLLAVGWLELLCFVGTGFAIRSWMIVSAHGGPMAMPVIATLLNVAGLLLPLLLLVVGSQS